MKAHVVLFLGLFLGLCSAEPQHPVISELFETNATVIDYVDHLTVEANWRVDQPAGLYLFMAQYNDSSSVYLLKRYDLGKVFVVNSGRPCDIGEIDGVMPPVWDWVTKAYFTETKFYKPANALLDYWRFNSGDETLIIGVLHSSPNRLVYYQSNSGGAIIEHIFHSWKVEVPYASWFIPPVICQH